MDRQKKEKEKEKKKKKEKKKSTWIVFRGDELYTWLSLIRKDPTRRSRRLDISYLLTRRVGKYKFCTLPAPRSPLTSPKFISFPTDFRFFPLLFDFLVVFKQSVTIVVYFFTVSAFGSVVRSW